MTRIVVTGACYGCPFNYDTLECRANSAAQGHDEEDRPIAPVLPTSVAFNRDGSDCDQFNARPDWCPLEQGPVEVTLDRCNDELSGLHCILPPHGTDVAHRAPTVPSDPQTSVLAWDDEGRVVTVDDKAKTREGGA